MGRVLSTETIRLHSVVPNSPVTQMALVNPKQNGQIEKERERGRADRKQPSGSSDDNVTDILAFSPGSRVAEEAYMVFPHPEMGVVALSCSGSGLLALRHHGESMVTRDR